MEKGNVSQSLTTSKPPPSEEIRLTISHYCLNAEDHLHICVT